jgi:uncharacterized delta-60 repeat protein
MKEHSSKAQTDLEELIGRVADQYLQRLCDGDEPDVEEYARDFPEAAGPLRQILPALEIMAAGLSSEQPLAAQQKPLITQQRNLASLGDFRLIGELGRGGMGVVYEAEQVSVGRRVAIKILPFAALLNETQLERFATEATAAARLQHSGIVQIYSVGCERGIHFYSMRLIEGPSLAQVITGLRHERHPSHEEQESTDTVIAAKAEVLTRDEDGGHYRAVARIGREAAEALHYAHENGVLHRDIKPSNLLLDKSGHVWIADFGLARVEDESQLTRTGDILGTLRYMSPEQATGDRVDARSDVYSLGATLYELATLQPVFDSDDKRDTIKQVLAGNPVAPHKVDSRIPTPLSRVISKSMARLDERYQSAQELAEDLRRFLDGEAVKAKPPTIVRRSKAWSRRHRVVSAAIVGLLTAALLLPFTTHHSSPRVPEDSPVKGRDMNVSQTAKVAATVAAIAIVTPEVHAKKPPKPPPEPGLTVSYELWGADIDLESVGSLVWEGGIVQQTDGKFLNVGTFMGHEPWLAHVTRWNIDGSVDTTFRNDASTAVGNRPGRIVFDVGGNAGIDNAYDVAVQPDGKIVMVGTFEEWSRPWIARLNADGSFDTDFGLAGVVDDILPNDYAKFRAVTLLSDGSIVAAGDIHDNPISLLLVKFTPWGSIDASFGIGGVSIINFGEFVTIRQGNGLQELSDKRLIAPGSGPGGRTSAVFMFNSNGSLDTTFADNGLAEIDLQPGGAEFFHALAIQPDGKIVAVGASSSDPSTGTISHLDGFACEKFSIARFNADGSLDNRKFAKPKGYRHLNLAAGGKGEFSDVQLLADGKILAVGEGDPGDGTYDEYVEYDVYLARFQADGTLDTSFDNDGWINMAISDHARGAGLVILDDNHYMIGAAGVDFEAWSWSTLLVKVSEE